MIGAAGVRGRTHGRLGKLALDAPTSLAKGATLEEQTAFELLGQADDYVDRQLAADLRGGLAGYVGARVLAREARHDGHEYRRDDGVRLGDTLRVA